MQYSNHSILNDSSFMMNYHKEEGNSSSISTSNCHHESSFYSSRAGLVVAKTKSNTKNNKKLDQQEEEYHYDNITINHRTSSIYKDEKENDNNEASSSTSSEEEFEPIPLPGSLSCLSDDCYAASSTVDHHDEEQLSYQQYSGRQHDGEEEEIGKNRMQYLKQDEHHHKHDDISRIAASSNSKSRSSTSKPVSSASPSKARSNNRDKRKFKTEWCQRTKSLLCDLISDLDDPKRDTTSFPAGSVVEQQREEDQQGRAFLQGGMYEQTGQQHFQEERIENGHTSATHPFPASLHYTTNNSMTGINPPYYHNNPHNYNYNNQIPSQHHHETNAYSYFYGQQNDENSHSGMSTTTISNSHSAYGHIDGGTVAQSILPPVEPMDDFDPSPQNASPVPAHRAWCTNTFSNDTDWASSGYDYHYNYSFYSNYHGYTTSQPPPKQHFGVSNFVKDRPPSVHSGSANINDNAMPYEQIGTTSPQHYAQNNVYGTNISPPHTMYHTGKNWTSSPYTGEDYDYGVNDSDKLSQKRKASPHASQTSVTYRTGEILSAIPEKLRKVSNEASTRRPTRPAPLENFQDSMDHAVSSASFIPRTSSTSTFDEYQQQLYLLGRATPPRPLPSIVDSSDKKYATNYSYGVMKEVTLAHFNEHDRRGKRQHIPVGFPGLACKHCNGLRMPSSTSEDESNSSNFRLYQRTGRYFPSTIKTFSDTKKTLNAIFAHLLKCHRCPQEVKQKLLELEKEHSSEQAAKNYGSQSRFFSRLWQRIHDIKKPDDDEATS